MSLNRTALRLAVIEALRPFGEVMKTNAAEKHWPTAAQDNIADSLIEPWPATDPRARLPFIGVFTDEAHIHNHGAAQDVTFPDQGLHRCILAIEIIVPQTSSGPAGPVLQFVAETNAAAEMFIETIEAQVFQALAVARLDGALRHALITIDKVESQTWRDPDSNLKLSARRIEIECRIPELVWPAPGAAGLAGLPRPLRDVVNDLPANSPGRLVAAGIATILDGLPQPPPLEDIRTTIALSRDGESPASEGIDFTASNSFGG